MGDFGISYLLMAFSFVVIWIVYRAIVRKRHNITLLREIIINLFFIYFLAVIYYTFFKYGVLGISFNNHHYINIIPLRETINMFTSNFMGLGNSLYNVVGNLLLFVPLGFFIPLLFKKAEDLKKALLFGFMGSVSIEAVQYFTAINITDIDDVIFNTLGAGLGFIIFKILRSIGGNKLIERVQNKDERKIISLAVRPLGAMLLFSVALTYGVAYKSTFSPKLSHAEMAKEAFAKYSDVDFVAFKDFHKYKLSLKDEVDYLELGVLQEVFNGRYSRGWSSQLNFEGNKFGYKVEILHDYEKNEAAVVVFGKNNNSDTVVVTFNGDDYSEKIKPDEFFIVIYPEYKKLREDTDIYNIFNEQDSEDLKVEFLNYHCKVNSEIKFSN